MFQRKLESVIRQLWPVCLYMSIEKEMQGRKILAIPEMSPFWVPSQLDTAVFKCPTFCDFGCFMQAFYFGLNVCVFKFICCILKFIFCKLFRTPILNGGKVG